LTTIQLIAIFRLIMSPDIKPNQIRGKDQLTPNILNQIRLDVLAGIKNASSVPQNELIASFDRDICQHQARISAELIPTGQTYNAIAIVKDGDFTEQSFLDRATMAVEIGKLSQGERDELATDKLNSLYDNYKNSTTVFSSNQHWRNFVQAYQLLPRRSNHMRMEIDGMMPDFNFDEFVNITTPSRLNDLMFRYSLAYSDKAYGILTEDTKLQENIAKSLGILNQKETWVEFINRENIKEVDVENYKWLIHEKKDIADGKIIGYYRGEYEHPGYYHPPIIFVGAPTKYPQVRSTITFDCVHTSLMFEKNLKKSIEKGILYPQVRLSIPTSAFV
jgi:hypothetical protein